MPKQNNIRYNKHLRFYKIADFSVYIIVHVHIVKYIVTIYKLQTFKSIVAVSRLWHHEFLFLFIFSMYVS